MGVGGQYPDEWVSRGAAAPERWVQGERSLPLVVNRRNDCWRRRAQCLICATGREGCNGRRAAGLPCQDGAVLQRTSCGPPLWSNRVRSTISALYYTPSENIGGRSLYLHFRNHILLNESRSAIQDAPNANTAAIRPALEGLAPLTSS